MKKNQIILLAITSAFVLTLSACTKEDNLSSSNASSGISSTDLINENGTNPDEKIFTETENNEQQRQNSFVYILGNDAAQNSVLCYRQQSNGHLSLETTVMSGGTGNGGGLGSQGAVITDKSKGLLFAVNAGDNTISSFTIGNNGHPTLVSTVPSGGVRPISVTQHMNKLYVVNAGSNSIHGFTIGLGGILNPIVGSMQSTGAGAAQISFSPNGNYLYVTEKATNMISRFMVNSNGMAGLATSIPSVGQTPFGFEFARNNYMIVSNAAGGAPAASSLTSYAGINNGNLNAVNGAVPSNQAAACWVATTKFGRYAFVTNTASDNISSYYIGHTGRLHLIHPAIVSGDGPLDMVVTKNNFNAYTLCGGDHTIQEYSRTLLGGLSLIGSVTKLPPSAVGMATY